MSKRTGGRWLVAALTACAAFASGCAEPVDPDELPGVYRNEATGGKILLESDGTFSATDVSADASTGRGGAEPVDFSGDWDFVDEEIANDFVYLFIEPGELGKVGGIQLYTSGQGTVEFRPDPDEPPSLVLTRESTQ